MCSWILNVQSILSAIACYWQSTDRPKNNYILSENIQFQFNLVDSISCRRCRRHRRMSFGILLWHFLIFICTDKMFIGCGWLFVLWTAYWILAHWIIYTRQEPTGKWCKLWFEDNDWPVGFSWVYLKSALFMAKQPTQPNGNETIKIIRSREFPLIIRPERGCGPCDR